MSEERRRPSQATVITLIQQAVGELDAVRAMLLQTAGLLIEARNRWAGLDMRPNDERQDDDTRASED